MKRREWLAVDGFLGDFQYIVRFVDEDASVGCHDLDVSAGFLLEDGPLDDAAVLEVDGLLVVLGQGRGAAEQRGTEEEDDSFHVTIRLF